MAPANELFKGLNFVIVIDGVLDLETKLLVERLKDNSANQCIIYNKKSQASIPVAPTKSDFKSQFNHDVHTIICIDVDFWFYRIAAFDFLIPVVTPDWVSACISTRRLTRASCFSPDPSHVLKQYQIYISRHSFSPAEYEMYSAVINCLGGASIDYLSSKTSHILTTDAQDPAIAAVVSIKFLYIKYVLPTWLIDVFTRGTYVDETKHLLDPHEPPEHTMTKVNRLWNSIHANALRAPVSFLQHRKIFLSLDLILPSECYSFFIDLLRAAGGEVLCHIDQSEILWTSGDCYIGGTTGSAEFNQASSQNLYTGNIQWIFSMWSLQRFILPSEKLLLSPLRPCIFQKSELVLSYTNYMGQQRHYIQRLVEALGGKSTTELTKKNTHLLSCLPHGQKYEAASRWGNNCIIVNHLWLEDCYKEHRKMPCNNSRYKDISLPGGLSTKLGQMCLYETPNADIIDEDMTDTVLPVISLERSSALRHESEPTDTQINFSTAQSQEHSMSNGILSDVDCKHPGEIRLETDFIENEDSITSNPAIDDTLLPRKRILEGGADATVKAQENISNSNINKESSQEDTKTDKNNAVGLLMTAESSQNDPSSLQLRQMSPSETPSPTPHLHSQLLSSGNSRKAKEKAALKLHTDMESLNEFEQNLKRKKNRSLLPEEIQRLKEIKEVEEKVKHLHPHRTKASGGRPYNIVAVCTGCHEEMDNFDLQLLQAVGIIILKTINAQCNAIFAPKKMRTAKFLTGLSFHPLKYALLPDFLTEILLLLKEGGALEQLPAPEEYSIPDMDPDVLARTALATKVFQRAGIKSINITDDVPGGEEVLSSILKAHGVEEIRMLPKKFSEQDIIVNSGKKSGLSHVLIAQKATHAKKFARFCDDTENSNVMVVEWNWCVESIFTLKANLQDSKFIVFRK